MKMPIEWHEECLSNMLKHYRMEMDKYLLAKLSTERLFNECQKYRAQIESAKEKGKASFDSDRYRRKREEP
jgi:hypothetical protein